jgi:hypothetical protein
MWMNLAHLWKVYFCFKDKLHSLGHKVLSDITYSECKHAQFSLIFSSSTFLSFFSFSILLSLKLYHTFTYSLLYSFVSFSHSYSVAFFTFFIFFFLCSSKFPLSLEKISRNTRLSSFPPVSPWIQNYSNSPPPFYFPPQKI